MSRYGDAFREPRDSKRGREELRDDLRQRDDWSTVDEYARYEADRRCIDILDQLQRRIASWASDAEHNEGIAVPEYGDFRDHVIDLLVDQLGAAATERAGSAG